MWCVPKAKSAEPRHRSRDADEGATEQRKAGTLIGCDQALLLLVTRAFQLRFVISLEAELDSQESNRLLPRPPFWPRVKFGSFSWFIEKSNRHAPIRLWAYYPVSAEILLAESGKRVAQGAIVARSVFGTLSKPSLPKQ